MGQHDTNGGGPLAGLRVVELASSRACFAGKLLAIYGADVVVVEPPGGHETRRWAPFAGDVDDPVSGSGNPALMEVPPTGNEEKQP